MVFKLCSLAKDKLSKKKSIIIIEKIICPTVVT